MTSFSIPFTKASACGNDFLIIDGADAPADIAAFTRRICERHEGVGADGVEWLFPANDADIHARLINADGSEAEISGNGTRCVAAYLCSQQAREKIVIRTGAGLKICTLTSRSEQQYEFEIAMGKPEVGEAFSLPLSSGEVRGVPVSMGNPHYVIFVPDFAPNWRDVAAEIQRNSYFKQGINVELVKIQDKSNIDVRFFERGVGETQSSGTGSSAAAVATIATGQGQSPLRVHTPGGLQGVRWEDQLFLRGSARILCRGEFFL
ncbi:MAG: diaminopimelate epimerase [Acidobacteria bacterium]|nr:diaminopimelate epimerase [Acidobacteriota bacterium]